MVSLHVVNSSEGEGIVAFKLTRGELQLTCGLWLVMMGLLTGCHTKHVISSQGIVTPGNPVVSPKIVDKKIMGAENSEKDGQPPGPLPVLFQKIKPVDELLSRYGNPDSYSVDGRTYKVMTTASGYCTRGLASWYGTKFHNKSTSSGEDYDMYALTAAHKTLPLPTYVKVRNLNNERVAIVKVNDRGPFHEGRIIDLSYAAAAKLGLFPKGTAPVEIEALTIPGPQRAHEAHYYLQVGAFESEELAEQLRDKLTTLSPSPVFIEKYQHRFVVRAGPFADNEMLDSLKRRLLKNGIPGAFSFLM